MKPPMLSPLLALVLTLGPLLSGCAGGVEPRNESPSVALSRPQAGAAYRPGSDIEVLATASDPDGSVARVAFFVNEQETASVTNLPYRYLYVTDELGEHRLSAVAYDDQDASSDPASVTILVQDEGEETVVSVERQGDGAGRVTSEPSGIDCGEVCAGSFVAGGAVTLSALPDEDSSFAGWTGACEDASGAICTLEGAPGAVLATAVTFTRTPGAVTLSLEPTSVMLEPGESQPFTATLTGSDAGVDWEASGGVLEANGLQATYTAPSAGGDYTVTVTSEEDSSVSATASVTVSEPVNPNAPFAIVALPDTQNYVCSRCTSADREWRPEVFEAQTEWIAAAKSERNIVFATHEGDVVECANDTDRCNTEGKDEWAAADRAMDRLDGVLPYSVAPGDHDVFPEQVHDGDTSNFRRVFGEDRYDAYPWYLEAGPRELSHAQTFSAGGYTFLHLALEWEAPDDAIAWAQRVIEAHPGKPTILTTHGYLNDNSSVHGRQESPDSNDCDGPPDCNSAEGIFQKLVKPNAQIFMVLGGHYHGDPGTEGPIAFPSSNGEFRQVSQNDAGLDVYEMLANYQDYVGGGEGYLRILTFQKEAGAGGADRISVETYSPHLERFQTDDSSEFFFDLDFDARFSAR